MARVTTIQKSRKVRRCTTNRAEHHDIPVGSTYYTAAPGFRGRDLFRCTAHPFRASELLTGLSAGPTAAVEAFEDAADAGFDTVEDLTTAWEELKSEAESYRDERQAALDAWEYGNSQMEEYLDAAEEALNELEGWEPEEFYEEEPERSDFADEDEFEEAHGSWQEEHQQHLMEQVDAARDTAGSVSWT